MPFSTCPFCGGRSYSAATHRKWVCPYCKTLVRVNPEKEPAVAGNVYKGQGE